MRVLGLDPSLNSYGWCVYDHFASTPRRKRVASGHEGTLKEWVPVIRFMQFRSLVSHLILKYEIDAVGIESPAYGGGPFSERHFGLMLFSLESVFEARKDCVLFDPKTSKLAATGKGDADKADIQREVQIDTMNPKLMQNDEADAYCIARSAAKFLLLVKGELSPEDLSPSERRVFLERTKKRKVLGKNVSTKKVAHVFRENSRYFLFSKIPYGNVNLPEKSMINQELIDWLENQ